MDTDSFVVDIVNRIAQNSCITVTARVVEIHQQILILLVVIYIELGTLQEVERLLLGLLERTAQTLFGELFVTRECNLANLNL